MSEYFLKPKSIELNLSTNATKADLKNATGVDTSDFVKKTDFSNLKSGGDKLDIGTLKNVPNCKKV